MKLQGLSIIFTLIVIPIVLVSTYYIQLQVNTITLQTAYDSKLLDATHGAMLAFELNTANEDLSSVADSLRTIIDASNNTFINTLSTNMGLSNASKSYMTPYVPAILYTLYDGYYIYSPTKTPEIAVDGSGVALEINSKPDDSDKFSMPGIKYNNANEEYIYNESDTDFYELNHVPAEDYGELLYKKKNGNYTTNINNEDLVYSTEHILKTYMPYSARYIKNNIDVIINYSVSNYISVMASINGVSYTKSGYLIPNSVSEIKIGTEDILKLNQNDAEERIINALKNGQEVTAKVHGDIEIKTNNINTDEADSILFFAKNKIFSDWVYTNLGDIEEQDIVENLSDKIIGTTTKEIEDVIYSFKGKNNKIFDISQNPTESSSTFNNHKHQVIRNSIQYNLNLAMSIYNERTTSSYDFNMPVISEDEWERIIGKISIVSFMQGVKCGLKIYNNYAIVSSTNNEIYLPESEIYFVLEDEFNNGLGIYHRIDCPKFKEKLEARKTAHESLNLTSFSSKDVKYDKVYDKHNKKYVYDYKNLACYTCIIDGNYEKEIIEPTDEYNRYYEKQVGITKYGYNLYEMNEIKNSEGYEIIYDKNNSPIPINNTTQIEKREIKEVQITFGHITVDDPQIPILSLYFKDSIFDGVYTLNSNQSKEQTITIPVNKNENTKINFGIITENILIQDENLNLAYRENLINAIKTIKVIYK